VICSSGDQQLHVAQPPTRAARHHSGPASRHKRPGYRITMISIAALGSRHRCKPDPPQRAEDQATTLSDNHNQGERTPARRSPRPMHRCGMIVISHRTGGSANPGSITGRSLYVPFVFDSCVSGFLADYPGGMVARSALARTIALGRYRGELTVSGMDRAPGGLLPAETTARSAPWGSSS
jgi:hypothetical protein